MDESFQWVARFTLPVDERCRPRIMCSNSARASFPCARSGGDLEESEAK